MKILAIKIVWIDDAVLFNGPDYNRSFANLINVSQTAEVEKNFKYFWGGNSSAFYFLSA